MKVDGGARSTRLHLAAGVAVLVLLGAGSARGDSDDPQELVPRVKSEPFLGVVEVPAISQMPESDPMAAPRTVPLRSQPALEAPIVRVAVTDLERKEHRYEESAALVYERRVDPVTFENGWYRVGYVQANQRHSGWLAPEDAGPFRSLHDLLSDGMNYMTESWDRRLYRKPGIEHDYRIIEKNHPPDDPDDETDVEVVKLGEVGKELWALVVVLGTGRCAEGHGTEAVIAAGWVPVFDASGKLNVWFFARGC